MSSNYYGRSFDHSQYPQKHTYPSQWRPSPNPSPRLNESFSHLYTPPQSTPRLEYFSQRPHTPRTFRKASIEPLILDYGENNNSNPYARAENSFQNSFFYNWGLCILSVIISILSMGAITALLILVDGNPIPKLPLNITVNTLVSFLSTIAKASMLVPVAESISQLKWLWFRQPRTLQDMQIFDDASRGPLGAARLIFKTRAVRLAAVGAAITVLSLVMDPASQQIVGFPERSVIVGGASVGRAQAYDAGLLLESLDGGLLTGTEFGMKAAIYDGIFKPSGAHDLEPVCPTGNCTFPLFDSLAVCSKCVDVSKDVINNTPQSNPTKLVGDHEVSYTMPGGATIKFVARFAESMLQMGPAFVSTAGVPPTLSKEILGLQDPLFTLAVLQFPDAMLKIADGNYFSSLPVANECALYFCVNTYNVSVLNSKPNTTVVSSWTSDTGTPTVGGKTKTGNSMIGTKDAILERPTDGVDGNHTYWIPAGTLANLKAWLNSTLQGSMNTSTSLVDTSNGPVWANDEIQTLNVTTDWSYLMGALATCMTTYIRSSGFKDSVGVAEGTAFKNETYVQVQWVWLCLPMALVSMSILFLVATMIVNHRKRAMAWKSSSLALLFHGLEGVGSRGTGEGMGDMDELAKKTRVILTRGDNGEYKLINTG